MKVARRVATVLVCSAMFVVPGGSGAEAAGPRTVEHAYDCSPCGVSFGPFGAVVGRGVTFWPRAREHYVKVHVATEVRDDVPFEVWQGGRFVGRGCGEAGPFLIEPNAEVAVFPLWGACALGPYVSVTYGTEGTARATFYAHRGATS